MYQWCVKVNLEKYGSNFLGKMGLVTCVKVAFRDGGFEFDKVTNNPMITSKFIVTHDDEDAMVKFNLQNPDILKYLDVGRK